MCEVGVGVDVEDALLAVADEQEIPGSDAGTFALLVDGSASMLDTDPERFRVEAAAPALLRPGEPGAQRPQGRINLFQRYMLMTTTSTLITFDTFALKAPP